MNVFRTALAALFAATVLHSAAASSYDYATLHSLRTGDASKETSYYNGYRLSLDQSSRVETLRLSGAHANAVVYAPLCNGAGSKEREFTFNDENMIDPARRASYLLRVTYNCSESSDGTALHAAGELGVRTRDSPLWKIWTYATYASDQIRLGRKHPLNERTAQWTRSKRERRSALHCSHSTREQVCEFAATVRGTNVTYIVDFRLEDSHIYLPQALYMHFTSVKWARNARVRRVEDWPPLVFEAVNGTQSFSLDARLFVPHAFESAREKPRDDNEWPSFVAYLLQESPVAVASDSVDQVQFGTRVLERYTLQRDYIGSRMRALHTPVVDHFTLAQSLSFLVVFSIYIYHKSFTMERIALLLLNVWPQNVASASLADKLIERAKELIVFAVAWIALVLDARLSSANALQSAVSLGVWAYLTLSVASVLYLSTSILEVRQKRKDGVTSARRVFIARCGSLEMAATVALLALASVVRGGDDFVTGLLVFVAILVCYDSFRRFFLVFVDFLRPPSSPQSTASNIAWAVYSVLIAAVIGCVYSIYVMTRYIIYPKFDFGRIFTAVALTTALGLSLVVISARVHAAMYTQLSRHGKVN